MNLIPDNEIILTKENDLLKTKIYADKLIEVIENNNINKPRTIGLFGGWGSGKSSIVKTVQHELKKIKNIRVMTYNAWKYSEDALRRSFILDLTEKFELEQKKLLESFYIDKIKDIDYIQKPKKNWIYFWIILIPLISVLLYFGIKNPTLPIIPLFSVIITIIAFLIKESFSEFKVTINKIKVFSPEQFSKIFNEAIYIITKNIPNGYILKWFERLSLKVPAGDKIVIIIDNIDRCDKKIALELLITIKNFLEHDKCIFIIPIDDEALIKHIEFTSNKNELDYKDGEEFLRKFFNLAIRIKKFSNQDLFDYTCNLIDQYKLDFSNQVASMISMEYSKNPRRIIQFLNNLTYEREIAKLQEENDYIEKGSITKNVEFLAKVLIIKEEWPNLYRLMNFNSYFLNDLNKLIEDEAIEIDKKGKYLLPKPLNIELSKEQWIFFKRTKRYKTDKLDSFLRLQDLNRDVPDEIISLIDNGEFGSIDELINSKKISINQIMRMILQKLDIAINKRDLMDLDGFILINLVFEIINDDKYSNQFKEICKEMESFIDIAEFDNIISEFKPQILVNISKKYLKISKSFLRNKIISHLNKSKEPYELMNQFIQYYSKDISSLKKVRQSFSKLIEKDISNYDKFKSIIDNEEILNALMRPNLIDDLISGINDDVNDDKNKKVISFIKELSKKDLLNENHKNKYINSVSPNLNTDDYDKILFWFQSMNNNLPDELNDDIIETLETNLRSRYNFLFDRFYTGGARDSILIECNLLLIKLMGQFIISSRKINSNINDFLINYLNRNESDEMIIQVCSEYIKIIECIVPFDWLFASPVIERLVSIPGFDLKKQIADVMYLMLKKTKMKNQELIGLDKGQIENSVEKFFSLYFSNDPDETKLGSEVISKILKLKLIRPFIEQNIRNNRNVNQQNQLLKLANEIDNEELIISISVNILLTANNSNELIKNLKRIKNNLANYEFYKKIIILKPLDKLSFDNIDFYIEYIKFIIKNQDSLNKDDIGKVIDKLIQLFYDSEVESKRFVVNKLFSLKKYPRYKFNKVKKALNSFTFKGVEHRKKVKSILEEME